MKKILITTCVAVTGMLFSAQDTAPSAEEYYATLDLDGAMMAEYDNKISNNEGIGRETYRKRSHRRKRIIRPPVQGK